jgi:hypothetical protein
MSTVPDDVFSHSTSARPSWLKSPEPRALHVVDQRNGIGVGFQILEGGAFDPEEVDMALMLLGLRRRYFGDGVVALDCGANIGVHTIEWARRMNGWGEVIAIEAQERVFYALAGNIAINNCFNARAVHAAVAAEVGAINIRRPNYLRPGSFGSLEHLSRAAAGRQAGPTLRARLAYPARAYLAPELAARGHIRLRVMPSGTYMCSLRLLAGNEVADRRLRGLLFLFRRPAWRTSKPNR